MLKIKLVRFGKRNQPHYRIVIQEARTKRDGKYTANIGHYAPTQNPKTLKIDMEEYRKWMAKGAQPTETVASLAKRFESDNPFPPKKKRPSKKQIAKDRAKSEVKEVEKPAKEEKKPVEKKPTEEVEKPVKEVKKETKEKVEKPVKKEAETK